MVCFRNTFEDHRLINAVAEIFFTFHTSFNESGAFHGIGQSKFA